MQNLFYCCVVTHIFAMTIWDKIYKEYKKAGKAWASLDEEIHPFFNKFLKISDFKLKSVFDIGCGDGRYLKLLQLSGFNIAGIDSSETAIEMAKVILENKSAVTLADMYHYEIPKEKYDLIISISALHHGKKSDIKNLIDTIYSVLVPNGKIFITIPDISCVETWNTFETLKEIEKGTFIPLSGPEKGLPHSFYTKEEIQKLFSIFKNLKLLIDKRGRWIVQASK
ncbi:MAG: class I SAM-dependent methyltransferase [Candidatus Heimdallarchaeota archaeon]